MNPHHVERLRQEQEHAISETDRRIKQLETFRKDYEALADKLTSLPEKVSHPVKVPFGKLAFMSGELVHTNEVLVLLGDNWFVQRSASQAKAIIARRIAGVDKQLEALGQQKGLLQPRLEYSTQLAQEAADKDAVEIKEAYDPTAEREWREEHRKNVQRYHQQCKQRQAAAQQQREGEEKQQELTDEQVWAQLEALEEQEERGGEMDSIEEGEGFKLSFEDERRKVRWEDQQHHKEQQQQGRYQQRPHEESESESSSEEGTRPNIITFTHTCTEKKEVSLASKSSTHVAGTQPNITSPSDIFKYFAHTSEPKSILKSSDKACMSSRQRGSEVTFQQAPVHKDGGNTQEPTPAPHDSEAFTATVFERQPTKLASAQSNEHASSTDSVQPPKRLSKFKQRRMQQESLR